MAFSEPKSENKLITDHLEIDKLLSRFRSARSITELEVLGKTYEGNIHSVSDVTLSIHYKGLIPSTAASVEVSVTSGHTIYTFKSPILDIQDSEITISAPTEMKALVKRKYKRVRIEEDNEAYLEFTVAADSMPSGDSGKVVPKYVQIYEELSKKSPDVTTIIKHIIIQLRSYADECNIVLYKKNDTFPRAIKVIRTLKESFYVRNTKDKAAYLTSTMAKVVSLGSYLKILKDQGYTDNDMKKEMLTIIAEDQKRGVKSYIYAPILLFGEVIGHIYVANIKTEFSDQNVYITISMAEIISEAFVKTKLFQLESRGAIKGNIINLSAGGALIEINDQYVMKFIHPFTKLKISLKVRDVTGKEHNFDCGGKVLRVLTNNGKNRIAMKFLELRWNEHDTIDKAVRKKIEFKQALNKE